MDPALQELLEGDQSEEIDAILKLKNPGQIPPHVRVVARFGEKIVTCRIRRDKIREVWEDKLVESLKAPRLYQLDPEYNEKDDSFDFEVRESDQRRPVGIDFEGLRCVIGVVDWGCDFAHPNFRNEDGSTRILALWDQSKKTPSNIEITPYGYGVVYSREDINRALSNSQPYQDLGYHPADGDPAKIGAHGTHVLDIAVGNGRVPGSPVGIAPKSDIIFVHLSAGRLEGLANLGDSVRVLEALDFIFQRAGGKPCVINLSMGRQGGEHTGSSLVEQAMDAMLLEAPGRAIVQSCGNYFGANAHSSGQLRPGQRQTITWRTDKADFTPNEMEIWYSGQDKFAVELLPPGNGFAFRADLDNKSSVQIEGQEVGLIYHRERDPTNGDNHIDIILKPNAPSGNWQISLIGEDIVDGRWNAWVERDAACPHCQSRFDPEDADSTCTTGTIANGYRTITCGAYNNHLPTMDIAPFSSSGPTRDGRQKPDLVAPGVGILAARSASRDPGTGFPMLTRKSGTSMASPHVAGTIALIFEASRRPLSIQEIRKLLLGETNKPIVPLELALRIGNGYLDIKRSLTAVSRLTKKGRMHSQKVVSMAMGNDLNIQEMNENLSSERESNMEMLTKIEGDRAARLESSKYFPKEILNESHSTSDLITGERPTEKQPEEETSQDQPKGEQFVESRKKRNFILLSGGPGPYDSRDVEHDQSWANYVSPPLLLTDTREKNLRFSKENEEIWWFVYKPAYERRWNEDLIDPNRHDAIEEVRKKGFTSYVNMIEGRSKSRNWNFRWLNKADDFWHYLRTFSDPISRLWYWGHARHNIWLSIQHSSGGVAIAPRSDEIISIDSIEYNRRLKNRFQPGETSKISDRTHRFLGCNTYEFAMAWSRTFKVWSEGIKGKVDFGAIHRTGGEPVLVRAAEIRFYSPEGAGSSSIEQWKDVIGPIKKFLDFEQREDLREGEQNDGLGDENIVYFKQENQGDKIVDLVKELVSSEEHSEFQGNFLSTLFSKMELVDAFNPFGIESNAIFSPANIYDTFVLKGNSGLRRHLKNFFDVIAYPRDLLKKNLQPGDMLIKRGEGNFAHIAMLRNGEIYQANELDSVSFQQKGKQPGIYTEVIEAKGLDDKVVRHLGDEQGRLNYDNIILRPLYNAMRNQTAVESNLISSSKDVEITESFSSTELIDHNEWISVVHKDEAIIHGSFVETPVPDSRVFPAVMVEILKALGELKIVDLATGAYQVFLKSRIYYPRHPHNRNKLPSSPALFPVVIFVHGNHQFVQFHTTSSSSSVASPPGFGLPPFMEEVNSYLGYEYLQRELARRHIVSMSISTNVANALNSLIRTRADIVLESLEVLRRLNSSPGHRFHNRLDLNNVGLVGHSRGGDAVVKAAKLNLLRGIDKFGIKGICSLAPTDFTGTAGITERLKLKSSDNLKYFVLYGSHDGDVSGVGGGKSPTGTGFRHYDRATCDKTMVFARGITHNRFNTKWNELRYYGDPSHPHASHPSCLASTVGSSCPTFSPFIRSASAHRTLAVEYIGGFFRFVLNREKSRERLLNGLIVPTGNYSISIQWSFGKKVLSIDDFKLAGSSTSQLGGTAIFSSSRKVEFTDATVGIPMVSVNPYVHHQTRILEMNPGGTYRANIPMSFNNLSDFKLLSFRMAPWFDVTSLKSISATPFPKFKIRVYYNLGGVNHVSEVNQGAIDTRGIRPQNRPFFHTIFMPSPLPLVLPTDEYSVVSRDVSGATINVTKIAFDTLVIPFNRFKSVNWNDVRAIEFESNTSNTDPIYFDSVAVIQP